MQRYSQSRALWAVTKASFKAIFANPTAIFFSLMFPIIFVLIFGAFGSGGGATYRVALSEESDKTGPFIDSIEKSNTIRVVRYTDTVTRRKDLIKGKLVAVLTIKNIEDSAGNASGQVDVRTTSASNKSIGGLIDALKLIKYKLAAANAGMYNSYTVYMKHPPEQIRPYRQIDYVLPGQLGFSILFSTLFGVAFTFFNLRESLVLKRFYASPVSRTNILLGIGMSRIFFQLLSVVVLILFGHFALNFTLHHGVLTFFEIVFVTIVMLSLLMGVGLIFSSIVKSDTSIPLLINLFGFPQMMLSGTFFPIEVFPKWLQQICQCLPLKQYNDAVRKISFEGLHVTDCLRELGILGIWIAIIYIILGRVLKWE